MNNILTLRKAIRYLEYIAKNLDMEKESYDLAVIYNSISSLYASIDIIENLEVTDV